MNKYIILNVDRYDARQTTKHQFTSDATNPLKALAEGMMLSIPNSDMDDVKEEIKYWRKYDAINVKKDGDVIVSSEEFTLFLIKL